MFNVLTETRYRKDISLQMRYRINLATIRQIRSIILSEYFIFKLSTVKLEILNDLITFNFTRYMISLDHFIK